MTEPLDKVIKQFAGKDENGKSKYNTVGYVNPDNNGRLKVSLIVEAVEKAIADRRQWEQENGKEPGKYLYLDIYDNDRSKHTQREEQRRDQSHDAARDGVPF